VTGHKRNRFDPVVLVPLLPVVCRGLPLLLVAGIGAAALMWGGAVVGGLLLVAVAAVCFCADARERRRVARGQLN
jgi:hypothetical protein